MMNAFRRRATQWATQAAMQHSRRSISYKVDTSEVEAIMAARKESKHMEKVFKAVEHHEAAKAEAMRAKAEKISRRATMDGYVHPDFTPDKIEAVMKKNSPPDLTIRKGTTKNFYDPETRTAEVVEPKRADMVAHEVQHHLDHLTKPGFMDMHVVDKEFSAFSTQKKVADELGTVPNMPHADPMASAETYRHKSASRFKKEMS